MNYNASHEGVYQTYTNQPDCVNINDTLTRHAQQLVAAGIDHVVVRMFGPLFPNEHMMMRIAKGLLPR